MSRSSIVVLSAMLSLSAPAFAGEAGLAPQRSIGMRVLSGIGHGLAVVGRGLGSFALRQVQMRPEMKQTLRDVKTLRKSGLLTAAAEQLRDAPKSEGMWERYRAWSAKKSILKAARIDLKAKRLDSDPSEGYAATATLVDARKTSWLDRRRANTALVKGVGNSIATARRLGNNGRYAEALKMLEWSIGEREASPKTIRVMDRLAKQALKDSDRAATRYAKAKSPNDQAERLEIAISSMSLAQSFAGLSQQSTGQDSFDSARAGRIAQRLGLSIEELQGMLNEHAASMGIRAQAPSIEPAQPAPAVAANEN